MTTEVVLSTCIALFVTFAWYKFTKDEYREKADIQERVKLARLHMRKQSS